MAENGKNGASARVAAWVEGLPLDVAGFGALLASFSPEIELVALATAAEQMTQVVHEEQADIAILRMGRPEARVWDLAWKLRLHVPMIRTVIVADFARPTSLDDLVRQGVYGLLSAQTSGECLRRALLAISSDEVVFEAEAVATLGGEPEATLTERQRRVLRLVAEGLGVEEIATRIAVSASTVKRDLHQLRVKLDTKSRTSMATYAVRAGIIP